MQEKVNYKVIKDTPKYIIIKDLGPHHKYQTITNGAEQVVSELLNKLNGRRLFYVDSQGLTDELLIRNGTFAGFRLIESAGHKVDSFEVQNEFNL